ncbi:L domain-like protein [Agrocybe pediades]|nr:L domain-like protein [Agrocybe pediades]
MARTQSNSTYGAPPKKPRLMGECSLVELEMQDTPSLERTEYEEMLWDNQIQAAFDSGEQRIELINVNLSHIPAQKIRDLSKMVVLPEPFDLKNWLTAKPTSKGRPFHRVHTLPGIFSLSESSPQKKTLSSNSALGIAKHSLTMFLGQNNISKLPPELWTLHNLSILSLRNNQISYLPPEIGQLRNLQSLNVASNNLKYLPAELMTLEKLTTLIIFPNPFIPVPSASQGSPRPLSQTTVIWHSIPPLTELTLRVLLSHPNNSDYTLLEQVHGMPLPNGSNWRPIATPIKKILSVCVPGSVIVEPSELGADEGNKYSATGIGRCPNPAHGTDKPIFVQHAEERYSWEKTIANILQGEKAPLLWRGCQRGCLDFLGPQPSSSDAPAQGCANQDDTPHSDNEVVQAIELGSIELDFDD